MFGTGINGATGGVVPTASALDSVAADTSDTVESTEDEPAVLATFALWHLEPLLQTLVMKLQQREQLPQKECNGHSC